MKIFCRCPPFKVMPEDSEKCENLPAPQRPLLLHHGVRRGHPGCHEGLTSQIIHTTHEHDMDQMHTHEDGTSHTHTHNDTSGHDHTHDNEHEVTGVHTHEHIHADGTTHSHPPDHTKNHTHEKKVCVRDIEVENLNQIVMYLNDLQPSTAYQFRVSSLAWSAQPPRHAPQQLLRRSDLPNSDQVDALLVSQAGNTEDADSHSNTTYLPNHRVNISETLNPEYEENLHIPLENKGGPEHPVGAAALASGFLQDLIADGHLSPDMSYLV
ncbi:hypothetical protein GWK47_031661 [Chionoecetes opilio]|uniref:Uncharacterized protein n=1 Tax=Chionoecetes opilio TaxID=41210 RepID=A0A8J4YQW0_CHIOP|nr:hypothetical protein GWK47_031661 [Chionoecetes opilio]